MADEKIITSSVFEQGITEIMQDIANNLYEFEEYTEEEVADLMDLSEEEVAELTRVINDTTVALNKVYSNKKVEDLLSELEVTCNKYADEKIGGIANIHLAYVDSLPSLGEDNTIYILKSTDGNDTLNLYDGTSWISIGEFAISLDNYYDKAEVDALLNDKANANEVVSQNDVVSDMSNVSSSTVLSTAGLEVELNKKVGKDKIVTVLDDTVTDEQVASALLTKTGLDKTNAKLGDKADKSYVDDSLGELSTLNTVKKSDANECILDKEGQGNFYVEYEGSNLPNNEYTHWYINTVAQNKNAQKQIAYSTHTDRIYIRKYVSYKFSAWKELATMDRVKEITADVIDANKETSVGHYVKKAVNIANTPDVSDFAVTIRYLEINSDTANVMQTVLIIGYNSYFQPVNKVYRRSSVYNGSTHLWSKWVEVCTTTVVADVGVTTITPVNSNITGTIEYTVKNGICYVSMKDVSSTVNDDVTISTTMPKSSINCGFSLIGNGSKGNVAFLYMDKNTTKLNGNFWISGVSGNCSFSYPVAE